MTEFKYYTRMTAANAVTIMPNPGKKLSEQEKLEMISKLTSELDDICVREKGVGISVVYTKFSNVKEIDLEEMIESALPKSLTKAQQQSHADSVVRNEKRIATEQQQSEVISGSDHAAKWVSEHFSDSMNNYNMIALIDFISGKTKSFNGLLNTKACDVMAKLGAAKLTDNGYSLEWQALKDKFESSIA
ncbi:hypothetical protein LMH73_009830 [Vibrio splendidus]|nr:hypothetical protein [Vibrio splendidus]MCC4883037.1 hypothetical protein [Vibrio splendidus]